MRLRFHALLTLSSLAAAALLAAPRPAEACGGVFSEEPLPGQPPEVITVAAQRIAIALSNEQTVLWSQIEYQGEPSDFAWVLPVGPNAVLDVASDAWIEALDAFTTTRVVPPPVTCFDDSGSSGSSSGGCCGTAAGDANGGDLRGGGPLDPGEIPGVTVLHEGSAGPYDTVTISAQSGQSAQQWLTMNGYAVPAAAAPVLDAYASEGLEFLAIRLQPGAGIEQMTPVRVTVPGGAPIVPMRMMVAGAGESVPVTLFVIGEGQYGAGNFPSAMLDWNALTWDFGAKTSNYEALRAQALATEGGRSFLMTFAQPRPFDQPLLRPDGAVAEIKVGEGASAITVTTLAKLYVEQARLGGVAVDPACAPGAAFAQYGDFDVVAACADGSTAPGPCPGTTTITASTFACGPLEDLGRALVGMRANDARLTRLEADLPVAALTQDLTLQGIPELPIAGWIEAEQVENVPCADYSVGSEPLWARRGSAASALLLLGAAGGAARRRRRPARR